MIVVVDAFVDAAEPAAASGRDFLIMISSLDAPIGFVRNVVPKVVPGGELVACEQSVLGRGVEIDTLLPGNLSLPRHLIKATRRASSTWGCDGPPPAGLLNPSKQYHGRTGRLGLAS